MSVLILFIERTILFIHRKKFPLQRVNNIEYRDLPSLSDDDLKQFGIVDAVMRRRMLDRFAEIIYPNENYDR